MRPFLARHLRFGRLGGFNFHHDFAVGIMFQKPIQFVRDFRLAVERWQADDGLTLAAATAYYVGLSFFPLLIVLTAAFGWFLRSTNLGQDSHQHILAAISENVSPVLAEYVGDALEVVQTESAVSGPIGLATMLFAALAALVQLDAAYDRIWSAPSTQSSGMLRLIVDFLLQRGRALLLLIGMGAVLIAVFLSGMVLTGIEAHTNGILPLSGWIWNVVQIGLTFAINTAVFTLINRLLPKASVRWSDALRGGLLTAAGWEVGRQILAEFVVRSNYTSAYGVIGAFLGVLLWCYYAVTIVLLGAEYVRIVYDRRMGGRADMPTRAPSTSSNP